MLPIRFSAAAVLQAGFTAKCYRLSLGAREVMTVERRSHAADLGRRADPAGGGREQGRAGRAGRELITSPYYPAFFPVFRS